MKLIATGMAGTLESSDISIMIEPSDGTGVEIDLRSSVEKQFGKQIRQAILETLKELKIENALIRANDKGALNCVIKARVKTAAYRAAGLNEYEW